MTNNSVNIFPAVKWLTGISQQILGGSVEEVFLFQ
jgi:hypothetical protein